MVHKQSPSYIIQKSIDLSKKKRDYPFIHTVVHIFDRTDLLDFSLVVHSDHKLQHSAQLAERCSLAHQLVDLP